MDYPVIENFIEINEIGRHFDVISIFLTFLCKTGDDHLGQRSFEYICFTSTNLLKMRHVS